MADPLDSRENFHSALLDFQQARRRATLETILSPIRGKPAELLSYDEVRHKLRTITSASRRLENIPIDRIIGSVNRYTDFSRSFLPRNPTDSERWARVRMGMESMEGLPPIEVYQVGEVYFVLDGHHRVSVARDLGSPTIEAYVTPVYTHVPLSPGDRPDDLILKSEYDDFLNQTHLDDLRPGADLQVTAPGQYPQLLEHIAVHRYFMGQASHAAVPYPAAVADWYDTVYRPIAEMIAERGLLRDFPGRTVADLYLWIMDHRVELSGGKGIGWEVAPELAAADLARRYSVTPRRRIPRILNSILRSLTPAQLEGGPVPGSWRAAHDTPRRADHLFDNILVSVPPGAGNGPAVQAALALASAEDARLTGLHAVADEAAKNTPEVRQLERDFLQACAAQSVTGRLMVERGDAVNLLAQRSQWVDLVVFRLRYPPPLAIPRRLRWGLRRLIRQSAAPLLAVPDSPLLGGFERALLAYGPGRKAEEALYMAAYLGARRGLVLSVLSAGPNGSPALLQRARTYLEAHGVQAEYIEERGAPARSPWRTLLLNAEQQRANLIIMGGYEAGPLRESLFGSTVDHVLRSCRIPVLICQ